MTWFLETVMNEYNAMRARAFASDGYEGVSHAGIAIVAADTGRVLLTKRADDPNDPDGVRGTWEFPGGGLKDGEDAYKGAVREFIEETGLALPDGEVTNGWRDGNWQGFVYTVGEEFPLEGWTPTTEVADAGWYDHDAVMSLIEVGALRQEIAASMDWSLVFPETEENDMAEDDETDYAGIFASPIPIHGVLAPEEVATGDGRGFEAGAMTSRPYRLPFRWQVSDTGQHNGAVVTGSVDRMMRKDGLIHYEGLLMPTTTADEFAGLMQFFGGRYGVSVDGDNGSLNMERSQATGVTWFNAVRASGLTAVDIPAFAEAYVAFGPHPDMPEADSEEFAALAASGSIVTFKRGPGWVTNPEDTKRIHDYWMPGHPGGDKIAWGTPGDFTRAKKLIGEKILKNSPTDARFLNQIIAQWHFDALGYWPGDLGKPGNAPDTPENRRRAATHAGAEDTEEFRDVSTEERKKLSDEGKALPDGSFPIANCDDLKNAIQSIGRAKDPAAAKRHISKRASALNCGVDLPWSVSGNAAFTIEPLEGFEPGEAYCLHGGCTAPATVSVSSDDPMFWGCYCDEHGPEHEGKSLFDDYEEAIASTEAIEQSDDGWEAVLVSSAGARALPPSSYFEYQPDSEALVILSPDENGLVRTYGYAGEWGVCHIGHDGRCVEVPPEDGDFPEFHLGRTKTADAGYINTGVITYKVDHRDSRTILSETAEQQHFDNIAYAWAAVRLGTDDRGIWFSGVVLPKIPADDLVLIEATGQVSGEWKYGALRALQAVNVPGFPVLRSSAVYDDEGNVASLIASAHNTHACGESPADRMAALRQIDAEVRFAALKEQFLAERTGA